MLKSYYINFTRKGKKYQWLRFAPDIYKAFDSAKETVEKEWPMEKIGVCVSATVETQEDKTY